MGGPSLHKCGLCFKGGRSYGEFWVEISACTFARGILLVGRCFDCVCRNISFVCHKPCNIKRLPYALFNTRNRTIEHFRFPFPCSVGIFWKGSLFRSL